MRRSNVTWVYVAVCNIHGVLLCSGLNNEDERQSAPLTEVLYCTSTRRPSSRYAGETGASTPPTTENGREVLMRHACARKLSPRRCFCWSTAFSPHPARSVDWPHGPCLVLAPCMQFLTFHDGPAAWNLIALTHRVDFPQVRRSLTLPFLPLWCPLVLPFE